MTLPATTPARGDSLFHPASATDKLAALAALSALPSRQPIDLDLVRDSYLIALEGTIRWALIKAVRSILQGSLPHAFLPSPPELRREHDRIMRPHIELRDGRAERQRLHRWEEDDERPTPPPDDGAKARAAAAYAAFLAEWEKTRTAVRAKQEAADLAEARIRNGIDAASLAAIPDRPLPKGMMTLGDQFQAKTGVAALPKPEPPEPRTPTLDERRAGLDVVDGRIQCSNALLRSIGAAENPNPPSWSVIKLPIAEDREGWWREWRARRNRRAVPC